MSTPWEKLGPEDSLRAKAASQLRQLQDDCGLATVDGKSLLEVGFKTGYFLEECRRAGMRVYGTEVSPDFHAAVSARINGRDGIDLLLVDPARPIPLDDETVDIVVSFQVLEHVASVERVLCDSVRLLRPGGVLYHVCPNYSSFYEGHYNVPWLPFLDKDRGRTYLRMLRRYTPYYETLNIVTRDSIKQFFDSEPEMEIRSLGENEFLKRFDRDQINKLQSRPMRTILGLLDRAAPVKSLALNALCKVGWYYPLTIIAAKRAR